MAVPIDDFSGKGVQSDSVSSMYSAFNFDFLALGVKVTCAGDNDLMNRPKGLASVVSICLKTSLPKVTNDCESPASFFLINFST